MTFTIGHRKLKPTRLPFGHINSLQLFQKVVSSILGDLLITCCLVYVDDVIVLGDTNEELMENLSKVLTRLRAYNCKLSLKKMQLMKKKVDYLGFDLSSEGIEMNRSRVDKILGFQAPKTRKGIQSFLGVVNYYRSFIPMLAEVASSLHKAGTKGKLQ